jgi:hypothetical protein
MEPQRREDRKEGFFGADFTDHTVFLDRIYPAMRGAGMN